MGLTPACYGKLPIHGDFIRHNVSGPEIDQLDLWIQGGILSSRQALGAAWDASFDATPLQRFLFQPSGGSRIVAGVVTASRDKPGRRFPFLVYTVLDAESLKIEPTTLPAVLAPFLEQAAKEAVEGWQGKDLKTFMGAIDALAGPVDVEEGKKSILTYVAGGTSQSLWHRLFGSPQDPRKYLLIHNLAETLRVGAVPRYALRFPGTSEGPEVSFWLEICRKLRRRAGLPTLSLWGKGREPAPPGLTLLMDELQAKYFTPVWWPERKNNLLFPLAEPSGPTDIRMQQAKDRYGALLDDGTMRLSTLMVKVTGN